MLNVPSIWNGVELKSKPTVDEKQCSSVAWLPRPHKLRARGGHVCFSAHNLERQLGRHWFVHNTTPASQSICYLHALHASNLCIYEDTFLIMHNVTYEVVRWPVTGTVLITLHSHKLSLYTIQLFPHAIYVTEFVKRDHIPQTLSVVFMSKGVPFTKTRLFWQTYFQFLDS